MAAAASAAAAATSYDSFDDRYLGTKSSDPTVDNDGNALVAGALYFSTSSNTMMVYDGSSWIAATSAGTTSLLVFKYVVSSGTQDTFTGSDANSATLSYTVNNIIVTLNGVVLDSSDFTATNGTSIVLGTNAVTNDELVVYSFKSFEVSGALSLSNGGTVAGNTTFTGSLTGTLTGNASTATTATNANHVNVADNESANENNLIPFIEDASATGNVGLESDGDFHYNPSTGRITATELAGELQTAAQPNITSTGTLTSATVSGDLTVDTTTLKVDSSNNRVGVGTASPDTEFHVKGATTVANFEGTGGSSFIGLKDSDDGTVGFIGVDGGSIKFQTSGSSYSDKLVIDANGHVTMPLQSAFSVQANQQNDLAVNASTTIQFANEIFDQNADFDHTNYTFQAPVTGKYMLNVNLRMDNVQYQHTYMYMTLYTSNRVYEAIIDLDRANSNNTNWDYVFLPINVLADMDASDTAYVTMTIPNAGSASSDIVGSQKTTFSGYLAC